MVAKMSRKEIEEAMAFENAIKQDVDYVPTKEETEEENWTTYLAKKVAKLTKTEAAKEVGKAVAKKAVAKGIKTVVFDRGGYHYTGRVAAVADGAREAGLEF